MIRLLRRPLGRACGSASLAVAHQHSPGHPVLGALMTVQKQRSSRLILRIYLEIIRMVPQLVLLFTALLWNDPSRGHRTCPVRDGVRDCLCSLGHSRRNGRSRPRRADQHTASISMRAAEPLGLAKRQTYIYVIIPQTTPPAAAAVHQPDYPYDQDYQPCADDRRCGNVKGSSADHRGQPYGQPERSLRCVPCRICTVFPGMLANQYAGQISRKKMELMLWQSQY